MLRVEAYHRPDSVEEVLSLLARKNVNTALVGGGTQLNAGLADHIVEVVDLQAVGLDQMSHHDDRLACGAMVRIQTIVEDEEAPALLREMARREGPNTFRNAGTVGGAIVAAHGESEFVAALLVYRAVVTVERSTGARNVALEEFLADVQGELQGGIVTGVTLDTDGVTAEARVARTPADEPIVAAIARRTAEGMVRLALCGVAQTPLLIPVEELDRLQPVADFRGSTEYRKEMAQVLSRRVLSEIGE